MVRLVNCRKGTIGSMGQRVGMLRPLATIAALALVACLAACRDEIPTQEVIADSLITSEPASVQQSESSRSLIDRQPSELLNWGVSEQRTAQGADMRLIHVSYSVNSAGGPAWDGVNLNLDCFDGTVRALTLSNLPWPGQSHDTLLIGLDDQPSLAEDVYLQRYSTYGPDGRDGEQAATQLDESPWYERLRSARTLTITLSSAEIEPVVFDLTRLFGTPLQEELDDCTLQTVQSRSR